MNAMRARRTTRRHARTLMVAALAVLFAAATAACGSPETPARDASSPSSSPPAAPATVGSPAPDFSLFDQFGHSRRLSEFKGKIVLLTFVSSRCTTICPLTAHLLGNTADALGPKSAGVQLVAVNTNYRYVSIADVLRWSQAHHMTHRWVFLTGVFGTLSSVWRAYGVTGGSQHTTVVFVIDARGRIRSVVPIAMRSSLGAEARALAKYVGELQSASA